MGHLRHFISIGHSASLHADHQGKNLQSPLLGDRYIGFRLLGSLRSHNMPLVSPDCLQLGPLAEGILRRRDGDRDLFRRLEHASRHMGGVSASSEYLEAAYEQTEEVGCYSMLRSRISVSTC